MNYVLYDNLTLGSPAVSIQDSFSPYVRPLEGNYSVVLQHSAIDSTSVGIGQTGGLPPDVASIVFYVGYYQPLQFYQPLQVTFAGNLIPIVQMGTTANYSIYGGNIAAYAGQTGALPFTDVSVGSAPLRLDDIQFSAQSIPEPGAFGVLALGGLIIQFRRWKNSSP